MGKYRWRTWASKLLQCYCSKQLQRQLRHCYCTEDLRRERRDHPVPRLLAQLHLPCKDSAVRPERESKRPPSQVQKTPEHEQTAGRLLAGRVPSSQRRLKSEVFRTSKAGVRRDPSLHSGPSSQRAQPTDGRNRHLGDIRTRQPVRQAPGRGSFHLPPGTSCQPPRSAAALPAQRPHTFAAPAHLHPAIWI